MPEARSESGARPKGYLVISGFPRRQVPSGKYFERTYSFDGFNRAFSGLNTFIAMFAALSVFYGISLTIAHYSVLHKH